MERFGWTPDQIADMTPAAQVVAMGSQATVTFKTLEDYQRWLSGRRTS